MTDHFPEGAVIITPAAMYAEQRKTHEAVIDLAGTVKAMADTIKEGQKSTTDVTKDHETRIRSLERKIWALAGAATLLASTAGVAASLLAGHR